MSLPCWRWRREASSAPIPRTPVLLLEAGISLTPTEWLAYYAECRIFLLSVGQKAATALIQASVFAATAAGLLVAAGHELGVFFPRNILIVVPAALGLTIYAFITVYYVRQVRQAGTLMEAIERDGLKLTASGGLIASIRESNAGFFGRRWSQWLVGTYLVLLAALPIAVAALVQAPLGVPP